MSKPIEKAIIGVKRGMTQIFGENGEVIPVTVIEAGPCSVIQIKTEENDGYKAVQLGFGEINPKNVNKPLTGHFKKLDAPIKRIVGEFPIQAEAGAVIKADVFAVGDIVDVQGTSKGKGFQGTIKRHNQHRIKMTHGAGPVHRHAGSMGAISDPSRIFKGKNLPGHMGAVTRTVQNLRIVKIDAENNLIAVKGAIPGANGGVVYVTDAVKRAS